MERSEWLDSGAVGKVGLAGLGDGWAALEGEGGRVRGVPVRSGQPGSVRPTPEERAVLWGWEVCRQDD